MKDRAILMENMQLYEQATIKNFVNADDSNLRMQSTIEPDDTHMDLIGTSLIENSRSTIVKVKKSKKVNRMKRMKKPSQEQQSNSTFN